MSDVTFVRPDLITFARLDGLGLYMMGETHFYQPATVFSRQQQQKSAFGTVFYSEGDYVHDMDHGFYDAYKYSGGERWKETASVPVAVSCIGYHDTRGDGVFDKEISMFNNDFSNASATVLPGRWRLHADQRVPSRRIPRRISRVSLPVLRHRGQLRAIFHDGAVARPRRRGRHHRSASDTEDDRIR